MAQHLSRSAAGRLRGKQAAYLIGINGLVFFSLCIIAQETGAFYLRVICEAFSASYLVLVTFWAWLSTRSVLLRLLVASTLTGTVVAACKYVLAENFAAWFEVFVWYLPVVSLLCSSIRLAGFQVQEQRTAALSSTFTIRALLFTTAIIAFLLSFTGLLANSRSSGRWDPILWLADALVLVVPVSLISVGLIWAVFENRVFHAGFFLLAAPTCGIVICQIWDWEDYLPTIVLLTTIAILTTLLTSWVQALGFRLVCEHG